MDLYLIYEFLRRLVKPFNRWSAYKTGVIDANGNVLVQVKDRTKEQKRSWGYYDRLIANLKKLIGKIPGGKTRIASFAAALLLLKEHQIDPDDIVLIEERLNHYINEAIILSEETPTNNGGSGHIASIGVGSDGEPPGNLAILKRKEIEKKKKEIIDQLKRIHK